jgi:exodeoxyribonuclease-3
MKIASWNVNSLRVRLEHVIKWLEESQTDILCLQELKMPDHEFPSAEFESRGYHCYFTGQATYNGVAIISKVPLDDVQTDLPGFDDPQRRFISATHQDMRLINVYVPNGQALDSDKFAYKRDWFEHLIACCKDSLQHNKKLVLVGDFNITPTDLDVHDPAAWKNKIHCSPIERLMLQKLMATGLYDTYRHFNAEQQFSWWDYRNNAYAANQGLRIDLILSSANMLELAEECSIDEAPRKLERPSDHTPVVATYN